MGDERTGSERVVAWYSVESVLTFNLVSKEEVKRKDQVECNLTNLGKWSGNGRVEGLEQFQQAAVSTLVSQRLWPHQDCCSAFLLNFSSSCYVTLLCALYISSRSQSNAFSKGWFWCSHLYKYLELPAILTLCSVTGLFALKKHKTLWTAARS